MVRGRVICSANAEHTQKTTSNNFEIGGLGSSMSSELSRWVILQSYAGAIQSYPEGPTDSRLEAFILESERGE